VAGLVLAGFSDGASYALSLGLGNGDLLDGVVAFSPGFAAPAGHRGRPPVFVSHGVADAVLPIDRCSRRIVPALQDEGYEVTYREFEGGHEIPQPVREAAGRWITEQR
jgi:predicted esterase